MPNTYFQFKHFRVNQERSGMKVTTDACLFGAWIADYIRKFDEKPNRILDIGTGTGLLALMVAQVTDSAQIDGVDMNKHAHFEAQDNFNDSPWNGRLSSTHSYIQKFNSSFTYNMIICNPPFFGKNLKGHNSIKNQAIHNDHLSMEELSENIDRLLVDDGVAWVLYPDWEMKAFAKWMEKKNFSFTHEVLVRNKKDAPIFRVIGGFSRVPEVKKQIGISIREDDGNYSEVFSQLLKDYYL